MSAYDADDFDAFMDEVNRVSDAIQHLKSDDTIKITHDTTRQQPAPAAAAILAAHDHDEQEARKRLARRAAQKARAEEAALKKKNEANRLAQLKEEHRDQLEQLKADYYLRKAKREKWEAFREAQQKRSTASGKGFTDYYRGWELFEEDPDEELFTGDTPAAVQDQAAFDAMAKDVEERATKRKAEAAAAVAEKERGNVAFRDCQYSEAVAAYSRAIEHFRADKAIYANRSLAHLRLRNFLSALEDATRAIDISTHIDEDAARRPPPPTLLKAHVRRAAALSELGRFDEAEADLQAAEEMAPPNEAPGILRLRSALTSEREAAKKDESAAAEIAEAEAEAAREDAGAMRGPMRVREILATLEPLVPTAGTADAVAPLIRELGTLMDTPSCRLCMRQAGGTALLGRLLLSRPAEAAGVLTSATISSRDQFELYEAGVNALVLRHVRAAVASSPSESWSPLAVTAPQLRLVALSCRNPRALEATKQLAMKHNAYDCLAALVGLDAPPAGQNERDLQLAHAAASSLVAALACSDGAKAPRLAAIAPQLADALVRRLASTCIDVRAAAATAIANLTAASAFRAQLIASGAPAALLALCADACSARASAAGRALGELVLPNALAALHNCSMSATVAAELSSVEVARMLVPLIVDVDVSRLLIRRAAAIVAKASARSTEAAAVLLGLGAIPVVCKLLAAEVGAKDGDEGAPCAEDDAAGEALAEAFEAAGGGGLLGSCVRILAAATRNDEASRAVCDAGGLPSLVAVLRTPAHSSSHGNAALAVAECSRDPKSLAVLAVLPIVPPLLDMANRAKDQAQKNAAIALGRLAKNEHLLQAIRDNHGIEILARALNGGLKM